MHLVVTVETRERPAAVAVALAVVSEALQVSRAAWEFCGAAEPSPEDSLTCECTVPLSVRDRGCPR
jgi:hypothetical protein